MVDPILDKYQAITGWNSHSIIHILRKYIRNQNSEDAFEDFLRREAEQELNEQENFDV